MERPALIAQGVADFVAAPAGFVVAVAPAGPRVVIAVAGSAGLVVVVGTIVGRSLTVAGAVSVVVVAPPVGPVVVVGTIVGRFLTVAGAVSVTVGPHLAVDMLGEPAEWFASAGIVAGGSMVEHPVRAAGSVVE